MDLSLIDQTGLQRYYAGPYNLEGDNYEDQIWFREVVVRGVNVSEVFMGHRRLPHFVISIRKELEKNFTRIFLKLFVTVMILTYSFPAGIQDNSGDINIKNWFSWIKLIMFYSGSIFS